MSALSVAAIHDAADGALVKTVCGRTFAINRFGWVLDEALKPVPHPEVDDVMAAVIEFDAALR